MEFFDSFSFYATLCLIVNAAVYSQVSYRNKAATQGEEFDFNLIKLVGEAGVTKPWCLVSASLFAVISFLFVPITISTYFSVLVGVASFFIWFVGTFLLGTFFYKMNLLPICFRLTPWTGMAAIVFIIFALID